METCVAYSMTDEYLSDVGSKTETDIHIRSREMIDAPGELPVQPFAQGVFLNLDDEPLREFTGVEARENDFEIYEWKARFGVTFSL